MVWGGGVKCKWFVVCLNDILTMECSDIVVVSADMLTFWQNLSKIKANWWGKPPITSHSPWHNLDTKAFNTGYIKLANSDVAHDGSILLP